MFSARQITFCGLIVLFYKNRNKKETDFHMTLTPKVGQKTFGVLYVKRKKKKTWLCRSAKIYALN